MRKMRHTTGRAWASSEGPSRARQARQARQARHLGWPRASGRGRHRNKTSERTPVGRATVSSAREWPAATTQKQKCGYRHNRPCKRACGTPVPKNKCCGDVLRRLLCHWCDGGRVHSKTRMGHDCPPVPTPSVGPAHLKDRAARTDLVHAPPYQTRGPTLSGRERLRDSRCGGTCTCLMSPASSAARIEDSWTLRCVEWTPASGTTNLLQRMRPTSLQAGQGSPNNKRPTTDGFLSPMGNLDGRVDLLLIRRQRNTALSRAPSMDGVHVVPQNATARRPRGGLAPQTPVEEMTIHGRCSHRSGTSRHILFMSAQAILLQASVAAT